MSELTEDECNAKAEEMTQIAARCEDPKYRAQFLRMAADWQQIAASNAPNKRALTG